MVPAGFRVIQAIQLLGADAVWDRGVYEPCIIEATPEDASTFEELTGAVLLPRP